MKKKSIREKFLKSVRENFGLPVKSWKKVCVKASSLSVKKLENGPKSGREIGFLPVKKLKKWPKMAFTGTFDFHGKKNTDLIIN